VQQLLYYINLHTELYIFLLLYFCYPAQTRKSHYFTIFIHEELGCPTYQRQQNRQEAGNTKINRFLQCYVMTLLHMINAFALSVHRYELL